MVVGRLWVNDDGCCHGLGRKSESEGHKPPPFPHLYRNHHRRHLTGWSQIVKWVKIDPSESGNNAPVWYCSSSAIAKRWWGQMNWSACIVRILTRLQSRIFQRRLDRDGWWRSPDEQGLWGQEAIMTKKRKKKRTINVIGAEKFKPGQGISGKFPD